jgi:hypothetical protein
MVRLYHDRELRARLAARAAVEYQPIRWELMKQRYLDLVQTMASAGRRTTVHPRATGTAVSRSIQ